MLDFESVLTSTKPNFTRNRASVISDHLRANNSDVIASVIFKKARGVSVKFYYYKNGNILHNDITLQNAKTLLQALQKNGVTVQLYNNGDLVLCTSEALDVMIETKESKAKESK